MKSLMKAGTRTLSLGLVLLAAVGWSCSRQDEPVMNPHQTEGAIAQARSWYESTAPSLTKTVADQTITIKPLPGEITPLWDRASATVLSDGTTAWVDVPITAGITYTAVRGGVHHHEVGEECGHDHSSVRAVQKLTIYTAADGTKESLIATIVPEPDCMVELNSFSSVDGLAGFSGFVSWHNLTGKLIRVAGYENGTKTRSVEATEENNAAVLEVVDNAVLYPAIQTTSKSATRSGYCRICDKSDCDAPEDISQHCNMCGEYRQNEFPFKSNCTCTPYCAFCGRRLSPYESVCHICPGVPVQQPIYCTVCGMLNCKENHSGQDYPGGWLPHIVQGDMFRTILGARLTPELLGRMLDGSYGIDQEYQNQGDEYRHGLYVPGYNNEQSIAFNNMRNLFIQYVQGYLYLTSESEILEAFYYLGVALHPIIDHYILRQTRVDMLNFYAYNTPQNIISGTYIVPYTSDKEPCTKAVKYIFNAVQNLTGSASEDEIAAIFDQWLDMAGAN